MPTPLNPSGNHSGQLAGAQQAFGVGGAGQGMPGLAGQPAQDGQFEDQISGRQPQKPLFRVSVVHGQLEHQCVDEEYARVVGHDQGAAGFGDVVDCGNTAGLSAGSNPPGRGSTRRRCGQSRNGQRRVTVIALPTTVAVTPSRCSVIIAAIGWMWRSLRATTARVRASMT